MARVNVIPAAGLARFRAAMDHVVEAQRELGRAAREISDVRVARGAWRKVGREHDRVLALWRALARQRESLGLDEIGAAALGTTALERER